MSSTKLNKQFGNAATVSPIAHTAVLGGAELAVRAIYTCLLCALSNDGVPGPPMGLGAGLRSESRIADSEGHLCRVTATAMTTLSQEG